MRDTRHGIEEKAYFGGYIVYIKAEPALPSDTVKKKVFYFALLFEIYSLIRTA